jgi:kumamolisin
MPGQSFTVCFPATSPHVLACGGTQLEVKQHGKRRETVWNQWRQYKLASGGGYSDVFSRPSYQKSQHKRRGIPDVAANASSSTGYLIEADNTRMSMGGTSAVAPLWAALIARFNEALGTKSGFFTPTVYAMAAEMRDALCDIVDGFNGPTRKTGFQAKRGWDACTGLGSPRGESMLEWLKLKQNKRGSPK